MTIIQEKKTKQREKKKRGNEDIRSTTFAPVSTNTHREDTHGRD